MSLLLKFRKISRASLFLLIPSLLLFMIIILANPVGFQKAVSITEVERLPALAVQTEALDIVPFIGGIPYQKRSDMVYDVYPASKYIKTIKEGKGNCSSLTFGAAYALLLKKIDFQILHLLPPDSFHQGDGHTVLLTKIRYNGGEQIAIVDMMEGGLPITRNGFLQRKDLAPASIHNITFSSLNNRKSNQSIFYGHFLDTVVVGVITAGDVNKYFRFIESVYMDLGSRKLEKYLYDFSAIILGKYPKIYVENKAKLKKPYLHWFSYHTIFWFFRVLPIWLFLIVAVEIGCLLATGLHKHTGNDYSEEKVNFETNSSKY